MEDRDHLRTMHGATRPGALADWRVQRVTEYIDANIHEGLPLADLARVACLSPFHFARAFKTTLGETPHAFVVARRVSAARELLRHSDLRLADVAKRCGFKTQSHFTGVFRKHVGLTPNVYRADRGAHASPESRVSARLPASSTPVGLAGAAGDGA